MNIVEKIKNVKKFITLYVIAFISLILLSLFNIPVALKTPLIYLTLFLMITAAILHLYEVFQKLWSHNVIKWIFAICIAYIVLYTDSRSYYIVYKFTLENPDNFSVAVNFLNTFHLYINLLVFLFSLFFTLSFLSVFIIPFQAIFKLSWVDKSFGYMMSVLVILFVVAVMFMGAFQTIDKYIDQIDKNLILLSSYYPNFICSNKELENKYIKLIGTNGKVSYANVNILDIIDHSPIGVLKNIFIFDRPIDFNTTICKKYPIK